MALTGGCYCGALRFKIDGQVRMPARHLRRRKGGRALSHAQSSSSWSGNTTRMASIAQVWKIGLTTCGGRFRLNHLLPSTDQHPRKP